MLGDTIADVKNAVRTIIGDETLLGSNAGEREIALTSIAAAWKTCSTMQDHFAARRAKMEEDPTKVPEIPGDDHAEFREQFVARHPDVLLPHHREPHRKLVERIQRDYLVHGAVPFYEVGEFRTRSEQIAQKSGLSKNAEDLLKVVTVDQPSAAASESQVMDKLHAFLVAPEYLNICDFTYAAGPLRYLSELEEWRQENRGLALLLAVDALIRKKAYRLNSDHRKTYSTFSAALLEVLNNHKQLWNDARSSAELDKFKQAGQAAPATPTKHHGKRDRSETPPKQAATPKAKKNRARRERAKQTLRAAREQLSGGKKDPPKKDARHIEVAAAKRLSTDDFIEESRFFKVFTKLRALEQVDFEKVLVMDIDLLVLSSVDKLHISVENNFQVHHMFNALHPWLGDAERLVVCQNYQTVRIVHFSGDSGVKPWTRCLQKSFGWPSRDQDEEYMQSFLSDHHSYLLWVKKDPERWSKMERNMFDDSSLRGFSLGQDGRMLMA
eukprot:g1078.t1